LNAQDPLASQLARFRELEDALAHAGSQVESAQVGVAVSEFYHALQGMVRRLAELHENLRRLMERHGILPGVPSGPSAGIPPAVPVLSSREGDTHVEKGWRCIESGDYEGAAQELKWALKLAPDDPQVLSSLGWLQTMSQDYDEALTTYQHLLVVSPNDSLARVNLGYICLKKGIYGEAIEFLSKAIRAAADPKAALYGRYYLGLVYLAREMYSDAASFFRETVELAPTMSEAHFQLGRALYLEGKKSDAIAAWKAGVALQQPDFWTTRCAEAMRAAESGSQPLLD
jgi:tetratricopeptide (TPR) repeat protein